MKIKPLLWALLLLLSGCDKAPAPEESFAGLGSAAADFAQVVPGKVFSFPEDHGPHDGFRIEWWYITGQAVSSGADRRQFGFQVTFFRTRVEGTQGMTSRFAAQQLLFAHAAITDVAGQKLWHDQRIARSGFGIASASEQDMALKLRDWSLTASGGHYKANLPSSDFAIQLQFAETQSVLLQGQQGL